MPLEGAVWQFYLPRAAKISCLAFANSRWNEATISFLNASNSAFVNVTVSPPSEDAAAAEESPKLAAGAGGLVVLRISELPLGLGATGDGFGTTGAGAGLSAAGAGAATGAACDCCYRVS